MLDDDELEEMADDIKANGLIMPLLVGRLDGQSVLVDGRNRREACWRAGVVPDYVSLDGADPVA
jgi:ParB-like chromosome segregation protein Spo0J